MTNVNKLIEAIKENGTVFIIEESEDILGILNDIHNGDEINSGDNEGWTVLHWACRNDQTLLISKLLNRRDIKPNTRNRVGQTAVMWAAAKGSKDTIKLLLNDTKVSLEMKDVDGWGIDQMVGCRNTSKTEQDQIRNMVTEARGKRQRIKDANGREPIEVMINAQEKKKNVNNSDATAEPAVEKIYIHYPKGLSLTEKLIRAIQKFDECTWKDILSQITGPYINDCNQQGWTPLHVACTVNNHKAAEALLKMPQILPNRQDKWWGQTPIMRAAMYSSEQTIQLMINKEEVDLCVVDSQGKSIEDLIGKGKVTNSDEEKNKNILEIIQTEKEQRRNIQKEDVSIRTSNSEESEIDSRNKEEYLKKIETLNSAIETELLKKEDIQRNINKEAILLTKQHIDERTTFETRYLKERRSLEERHRRELKELEDKFSDEKSVVEAQQILRNSQFKIKAKRMDEDRLKSEQNIFKMNEERQQLASAWVGCAYIVKD